MIRESIKKTMTAAALMAATVFSSCGQSEVKAPKYVNPCGDRFPIMGYHAFLSEDLATHEQFQTMADCGFTIAFNNLSIPKEKKALEAMEGTGIKLMVNTLTFSKHDSMSKSIEMLGGGSEIAGFHVLDEPSADRFDEVARVVKEVLSVRPDAIVYANLLPSYARPTALKAANFRSYLREYCEKVPSSIISYDFYPIVEQNGEMKVRPEFYSDLEVSTEVAREYGRVVWSFYLSTPHLVYPLPTKAGLRMQCFAALAYGVQGLQAYGYGYREGTDLGFHDSPIGKDGKKSKNWYTVRDVNREVQNLSKVFLGCEVIGVWHTGTKIPDGTVRLRKENLPSKVSLVAADGEGVLVSRFKNNGKEYLMVLNRDIVRKQKVRIEKSSDVLKVNAYGVGKRNTKRAITLQPGGYAIYVM